MNSNADYWNTIATVIPVLALTYATALKRSDWHQMKPGSRRWTALYGAALVLGMVWVEFMSLQHLQAQTTAANDEAVSFMVVWWAAATVLALPIAPLLVLALHDLHPKVLRIKRERRAIEREFADVKRRYDEAIELMVWYKREARIDGSNEVVRQPELVYEDSGRVRPGYRSSVGGWALADWIDDDLEKYRLEMEEGLKGIEKRLKKSGKRLQKRLQSLTKNTAKLTDMSK